MYAIQQNMTKNETVINPSQLHVKMANLNFLHPISPENSSENNVSQELTSANNSQCDSLTNSIIEKDNSLPEDSIEDFRLDSVIGNLVNFAKSYNGSR